MRFHATCALGLEDVLARELASLGALDVHAEKAGASFAGGLEAAYRACLWSRTASRILAPLATFEAADERALYDGARAVDWTEHLAAGATIAVTAVGTHARLTHTHYAALKVKDAIVDEMRDRTGARPSVDTEAPDVRVHVHLSDRAVTVSLDLAGEAMHRRGWREGGAPAPLKESLAAALLLLGDWPALAAAGRPFVDPMCGSGTLVIEAAAIAADLAPGLARRRHGFVGWRRHDAPLWARLREEAEARRVRDPARLPPLVGSDIDARIVRAARDNARRAGTGAFVRFDVRPLADVAAVPAKFAPTEDLPDGLVATNPPYGERLGEEEDLPSLYAQLGDTLKRRFPGWRALVLVGNLDLVRHVGLKPARRHVVYNGALECRLLDIPISRAPVASDEGPAWRKPREHVRTEGAEMFANRLRKNLKHLGKWAKREHVTCWRAYDADLPEYAVAVDLYEGAVHVQEYAPPSTVDPERAAARLADVMAVVPEVTGVAAGDVFLKVRRRMSDGQYGKASQRGVTRVVHEGGHAFRVNLSDYIDCGLFLDHRRMRAMIGERARGRDFLNLFSYTGSATVYAVKGGARSTTSVDLSNTYLDWAAENFALNGIRIDERNRLVRADVLRWLADRKPGDRRRYGLVFMTPPTFSNSKAMDDTLDVQRDHVDLIRGAMEIITPDGELLFSNHFRRFKMDPAIESDFDVENLTRETVPVDFARNPRIHNTWRITHKRNRGS